MTPATLHLITGGQRSGKSRHAESLGLAWLGEGAHQGPERQVVVLATAVAGDDEMRQRIDRHRAERPPGFHTVEEPVDLGAVVRQWASPSRLLIVDCLTLWLTHLLMPAHGAPEPEPEPEPGPEALALPRLRRELLEALTAAKAHGGSVLLVTNELGSGVVPLGAEVRRFVDEMGRLNQAVALACDTLTLMVAGQPWTRAVVPPLSPMGQLPGGLR